MKLPSSKFTGEALLLTFSVPQFIFHVTTAYDILRHSGVRLAKRIFSDNQLNCRRIDRLHLAAVFANQIRGRGASGHFALELVESPPRLGLAIVHEPDGRIP